ncbi:MAG TPA: arginine deiminase family protein [Vicinamibacterales bacterium]|nr:arginine deiminase family protein [Vicinamibacterales bacterium]
MTAQSETGRLRHVALKHPRDAFRSVETIAAEWQMLNFTAPPDLSRAIDEFDGLQALITSAGAEVHLLPAATDTTLDSIYVRDGSIVCDRGIVLCRMGKPQRSGEPEAQGAVLPNVGPRLPLLGRIEAPGTIEGGDVLWLDERTLVVGRGYRTNDAGISQLRAMLGPAIELVVVPLPHWHGDGEVMHLMSLISPVGPGLALVYSPLLPVPFRQWLLERGLTFIEVPDDEFDSMGTNALALSARQCVMLAGNSKTRAALERAGVEVLEYEGREISVKGGGGPTCLTRPLSREP